MRVRNVEFIFRMCFSLYDYLSKKQVNILEGLTYLENRVPTDQKQMQKKHLIN